MKSNKFYRGFSLIEVLIVTAILGVLMLMAITMLPAQLMKARDGQRKADLQKIKLAFENYYDDNECYPPETVLDVCGATTTTNPLYPYMSKIPCDPRYDSKYLYKGYNSSGGSDTCSGYRVYTKLEKKDDAIITSLGCDTVVGCNAAAIFTSPPSDIDEYNYGVSEGVPVLVP